MFMWILYSLADAACSYGSPPWPGLRGFMDPTLTEAFVVNQPLCDGNTTKVDWWSEAHTLNVYVFDKHRTEWVFYFSGFPYLLHNKYNCGWRPGESMIRGFSSHNIDLVRQGYFDFSTNTIHSHRPLTTGKHFVRLSVSISGFKCWDATMWTSLNRTPL